MGLHRRRRILELLNRFRRVVPTLDHSRFRQVAATYSLGPTFHSPVVPISALAVHTIPDLGPVGYSLEIGVSSQARFLDSGTLDNLSSALPLNPFLHRAHFAVRPSVTSQAQSE